MTMPWTTRHVLACCVLTALAIAPAALGQKMAEHENILEPEKDLPKFETDAQLQEAFAGIIRDLGSKDFAARKRATDLLNGSEQFTLAMIERALQDKTLSLEARTRLLSSGRLKFFSTPRAALGFQFGGALRDRVVVGKTFAPFASARLLEEGDMIVGADGYVLTGPSARPLLQAIIISHDPGEVIKLVVRRGGQKLNIDVPLGSFANLDQGGWLGPDRLVPAWKVRAAVRLGSTAEPVRVNVAASAWGQPEPQMQAKAIKERMRELEQVQIAGGGMPRLVQGGGLFEDIMLANGAAIRQQIVVVGGRQQAWPAARLGVMDGDLGLTPIAPQEELTQLLQSRMVYSKRVDELNKRLADKDLDPDVLESIRTELSEADKQVRVITKQMDAIQAEVDEVRAAGEGKHSAADANPDGRQ